MCLMSEYLILDFLELNQIDLGPLIAFAYEYKSNINRFKIFSDGAHGSNCHGLPYFLLLVFALQFSP